MGDSGQSNSRQRIFAGRQSGNRNWDAEGSDPGTGHRTSDASLRRVDTKWEARDRPVARAPRHVTMPDVPHYS